MKLWLLDILRCPATGQKLALADPVSSGGEINSGTLVTEDGKHRYPIENSIPRFVPAQNYADNFGFQWNTFGPTQLDSYSGVSISSDRFYGFSGWTPEDLRGRLVLDVGCGAGRFTEIALNAGARVVALDYSSAVAANQKNNGGNDNLSVVQGDIYQLPFVPRQFDFVYCFGVLQHTPDVRKAFLSLPPQLKPGGRIAVDVYPKLARNLLWPKYWLRPLTKRMNPRKLFEIIRRAVPVLLPLSTLVGRFPIIGRQLKYFVPVMNYAGSLPLSREQVVEWAILDTFDMFSPAHDHPQTAGTLRRWLEEAGLESISVTRPSFIVGRGTQPSR